eukprot:TRINITY_DN375_c0_g1_i3.p1 TRINITY_DN375_c0_g1~~TRINITY_DN375_c0_g1_i3.p1  ORF type:complete len:1271 (+),score=399.18 TRINITY_DN375_c0_g1_i3:14-3826(+)
MEDPVVSEPSCFLVSTTILRAKDLPSADLNGKSDPYVAVVVNNSDGADPEVVLKTQKIKCTLNPDWISKETGDHPPTLTSHIVIDKKITINFELWDWDRVGKDNFLGLVSMNFQSILKLLGSETSVKDREEWFPIIDPKKGAKGHLNLLISIDIASSSLKKAQNLIQRVRPPQATEKRSKSKKNRSGSSSSSSTSSTSGNASTTTSSSSSNSTPNSRMKSQTLKSRRSNKNTLGEGIPIAPLSLTPPPALMRLTKIVSDDRRFELEVTLVDQLLDVFARYSGPNNNHMMMMNTNPVATTTLSIMQSTMNQQQQDPRTKMKEDILNLIHNFEIGLGVNIKSSSNGHTSEEDINNSVNDALLPSIPKKILDFHSVQELTPRGRLSVKIPDSIEMWIQEMMKMIEDAYMLFGFFPPNLPFDDDDAIDYLLSTFKDISSFDSSETVSKIAENLISVTKELPVNFKNNVPTKYFDSTIAYLNTIVDTPVGTSALAINDKELNKPLKSLFHFSLMIDASISWMTQLVYNTTSMLTCINSNNLDSESNLIALLSCVKSTAQIMKNVMNSVETLKFAHNHIINSNPLKFKRFANPSNVLGQTIFKNLSVSNPSLVQQQQQQQQQPQQNSNNNSNQSSPTTPPNDTTNESTNNSNNENNSNNSIPSIQATSDDPPSSTSTTTTGTSTSNPTSSPTRHDSPTRSPSLMQKLLKSSEKRRYRKSISRTKKKTFTTSRLLYKFRKCESITNDDIDLDDADESSETISQVSPTSTPLSPRQQQQQSIKFDYESVVPGNVYYMILKILSFNQNSSEEMVSAPAAPTSSTAATSNLNNNNSEMHFSSMLYNNSNSVGSTISPSESLNELPTVKPTGTSYSPSVLRMLPDGINKLNAERQHILLTQMTCLVMGFSHLVTPDKFFMLLRAAWDITDSSSEEMPSCLMGIGESDLHVKICDLLLLWYTEEPQMFEEDLKHSVIDFLEQQKLSSLPDSAHTLLSLLLSKEPLYKSKMSPSIVSMFSERIPIWDTNGHEFYRLTALHCSSQVVAEQLTLIDWKIYTSITRSELKRLNFQKEKDKLLANNVTHAIQRVNNISQWVSTMILLEATPEDRAEVFTQFVSIASSLKKLHNFNSFMGVITGLNSVPITRLKKSMRLVQKQVRLEFEELCAIQDPTGSFSKLRNLMKEVGNSQIPYVGITCQTLALVDEGNPDLVQSDCFINFPKYEMINKAINEFLVYQKTAGYAKMIPVPIEPIHNLLLGLPLLNDDELYSLSRAVEPPQSKPN